MTQAAGVCVRDNTIAVLSGAAAYLLMHLIDAVIPAGRHFKFVDRWTSPDEASPPIDEA